ncbi:MAG: glycoside hydrolase family 25 protein [Oscillospiraceae bacterium]
MKRKRRAAVCLLLAALLLSGCGLWEEPVEYITYRGEQLIVQQGVAKNPFTAEDFVSEEGRLRYTGEDFRAMTVIDVSSYQGQIDWQAAAADGVEGAMLRLGYRGYGSETGVIREDARFRQNLAGALAAGLRVGVYFFSQAVTEEEAREEATFVLELLSGVELTLPVAFDWERTGPDTARTAEVTGEELTAFAQVFCGEVRAAGYEPMVYFNQDTAYRMYDLSALEDCRFWLAEYDTWPSFYYGFTLWQYSDHGSVRGVSTPVDLDLWLEPM